MVTCKLYGRLGNQMFQIAALIGYAHEHKLPFMLPARTENEKEWPHYFKKSNLFRQWDDRFRHIYHNIYQEPDHGYGAIPKFNSVVLNGYFQSYKYFDFCLPYVKKAFGFGHIKSNKGTVSIHVRRGDYLIYPAHHPVVTVDYLYRAIKLFDHAPHTFVIFSDDIQWCYENLNSEFFSRFDQEHSFNMAFQTDPLYNMQTMATCEHAIISNSSYSYWPAILNTSKDRVIVTPHEDNWFGPANKHLDVSDLLPSFWKRIKY